MLINSARLLLRRWPWVVAAVVLACTCAVGAFVTVKPDQTSQAEVFLVPSAHQAGVAVVTNPLLNVGQSTTTTGFIVQTLVTSDATVAKLAKRGASAKFTIVPNTAPNSGPTLTITTLDRSATVAQQTLDAVIQEFKDTLASVQKGLNVPSKLLIQSLTLTKSPNATPVRKTQMQATISTGIGALFALLVLILLVERRRQRRAARIGAAGAAPVAASPAATPTAIPAPTSIQMPQASRPPTPNPVVRPFAPTTQVNGKRKHDAEVRAAASSRRQVQPGSPPAPPNGHLN